LEQQLLLESKIRIPDLRPELVIRARLLAKLDEGMRAGHRLTLVSAPAGFGKTTLLAEWARSRERPIVWITLEEPENDPAQFLRYLVEALRRTLAGVGPTVQHLLRSPTPLAPNALLTSLLNDLADAEPFLLVFDDFHLIHSPAVLSLVEFLLEHAPRCLHAVLSTREDPALPIARYRVRGQITELRESDLRFRLEEAGEFLSRCMHLALPVRSVEALEARTEGWVAGLQLAAFALQNESGSADEFISAFAGDNRFVMDYLVAEVLNRLPEETRAFLRSTSILERLTAPLCDAVTGLSNSQTLLEKLESSNVFLFALDAHREWFRYHALFAKFLQARLDPAEESMLHERASAWCESNGMLARAVEHALAAGALSGRYATAVRLIGAAAEEGIREGRVQTVLTWLNLLPAAQVRARLDLSVRKGWALLLSGDFKGAAEYAVFPNEGGTDDSVRAQVHLLRGFLSLFQRGDYPETVRQVSQAFEAIGGAETYWRPMAFWLLAEVHERMGQTEEAVRILREGRSAIPASRDDPFAVLVDLMLVFDLNLCGHRREALALAEEALRRYPESAWSSSPAPCMLLGRTAQLHYEADQRAEVRRLSARVEELGARYPQDPFITFARAFQAPFFFAEGNLDAAFSILEKAAALAAQSGLSDPGSLRAALAHLHLRHGDLDAVTAWTREAECSPDEAPAYMRLDVQLVYARFLILQGHSEDAGRLLSRLRRFLEEAGMRRPLITVRILQALLADAAGDAQGMRESLAAAMEIAAPEDYLRAFLDEDKRVIALVPAVRAEHPAFVQRILAAAGSSLRGLEAAPSAPRAAAPESISDREREILLLVAEGLSNAQIAARLVIATSTVKRHVNNIFAKLAVSSRTQAVAKAKRLGLLR
jgi:LuxR family transcriptional regulator, maltose regulon positive regulatory protein